MAASTLRGKTGRDRAWKDRPVPVGGGGGGSRNEARMGSNELGMGE